MTRRNLIAGVIAVLVALGCVRLGIWQLDRLSQRRDLNGRVYANLAAAPVRAADLPTDTAQLRFRRLIVTGVFDFDNQIALAGRSWRGAPGVHVVTPLRVTGSDRAVLVNRGWVYAPDAVSAELTRWYEPETATVLGYAESIPEGSADDPRSSANYQAWRQLDFTRLSSMLPYPIERYSVVLLSTPGGPARANAPVRLTVPPLSEGPHKGYAFQWFSFALIAVTGVFFLIRQDVKTRTTAQGA